VSGFSFSTPDIANISDVTEDVSKASPGRWYPNGPFLVGCHWAIHSLFGCGFESWLCHFLAVWFCQVSSLVRVGNFQCENGMFTALHLNTGTFVQTKGTRRAKGFSLVSWTEKTGKVSIVSLHKAC
jgi:hypothetical protein